MRIAIAGGIGSGKSEALKVAREMGICTLSADEINARLLISPDYVAKIQAAFPSAIKDGAVDKRALAEIVFSDKARLAELNAIAHPCILEEIKAEGADPLAVEMPLLLESGAESLFDEIILIHTPKLLRFKRLKARGMSFKQAAARMRAQVSELKLRSVATVVIDNGGDLAKLRADVRKAIDKIVSKVK